jgi:hypothetical protein
LHRASDNNATRRFNERNQKQLFGPELLTTAEQRREFQSHKSIRHEGFSSKKTIKVKSARAEFGRISEGMTYEQVVSIIGTSGELIISNEIDGIKTMMYSWKNANGSNINAIFQNGKLIQKAQLGLP